MTGLGIVAETSPARAAPVGSLLNSAATPAGNQLTDGKWSGEIRFDPELCSGGALHTICESETSVLEELGDQVIFQPYVIERTLRCSTGGFQSARYQEKARNALLRSSSLLIENEFWTGTKATAAGGNYANNDFLANTGVSRLETARGDANDTSYDVLSAFAGLQALLGQILDGGRGMIHVPALLLPYLEALHLVEREGNILTTALGNIVVAGHGYPGTSPTGTASDEVQMWAYGTGIVTVWVSDVEVISNDMPQVVDRDTNDVEVRASRIAATTMDGCGIVGARFDTSNTVGIYG